MNPCSTSSTALSERCVKVFWPLAWSAYDQQNSPLFPVAWHGSLLEGKQDKTGTLYRRNRSYDPLAGRFTQEDPIGLAGGVNLYGFAAGDPVNFSDPFGLNPFCPTCRLVFAGARGGAIVGGSTLGIPGALIGAVLGGASAGLLAHLVLNESSAPENPEAAEAQQEPPTADEIISATKKGSIRREFPGEMLGKSRPEIDALSRAGNRAAQKARKLLTDKRFDKGTR